MQLVLTILIAFVLFLVWSRWRSGQVDRKAEPACIWLATGVARGRLKEYRCDTCGVTAYSGTGKAPEGCKKALKGGG